MTKASTHEGGGSKIGQKNVTYYLNGPLTNSVFGCIVLTTFFINIKQLNCLKQLNKNFRVCCYPN